MFLGSLFGSVSPVSTYSRLLGAEIVLAANARLVVPLDSACEHGLLLDTGDLLIDELPVKESELAYVEPGASSVTLSSADGARLLLLGGEPLGEQIVMWWNFIGRTDEEIRGFREQWQAQISDDGIVDGDFGVVAGGLPPIPAPALPNARLKSRG